MSFKSPWMGVGTCTDSFDYFCFEREREKEFFLFGVCFAIKIFSEKYPWLEHFFFSRNLQDKTQESVKGKNNCFKSNTFGDRNNEI